jgi:ribosomal protein S27AE
VTLKRFTKSPPLYFLGFQECPACHEPVFAAEAAEMTQSTVRYRWSCDICGNRFESEAALVGVAAA